MFRDLYHLFKAVPITWLMLFASGLLWAADNALAERLKIEYYKAQYILGAQSQFELWDGAWWTVLTTALHHGDVVHLLCNTLGLWWLGRLLETRMGSWRYALFCLSATAVSGGIQSLWSPYVGLSGVDFSKIRLIMAWRKNQTRQQT
jgi:membrane associated rhomboid family serine protease